MLQDVQGGDAAHGAGSGVYRVRAGVPSEARGAVGMFPVLRHEGEG